MRKRIEIIHHRERRFSPAVLGMAIPTRHTGVVLKEGTVQSSLIMHLLGNVRVTSSAALCHCRRFPWRGVTGLALATSVRMRGHTTQSSESLRAQLPRTIKQAAARISKTRDDEGSNKSGKNPRSRQTAKTTISHLRFISKRWRNITRRQYEQTRRQTTPCRSEYGSYARAQADGAPAAGHPVKACLRSPFL